MIRVMLVAGSNTKQLATFLEQRGTFEVSFQYADLYSKVQEVTRSVIKVDKFVYLFQYLGQSSDEKIRLDMQTLREMLLSNKFFHADEIIFLSCDGNEYDKAKQYFSAVMEECSIEKYSIKGLDAIASFSSVYDNLIGVTVTSNFENKYYNLYRRGKGDNATIAYEPTNDREIVIEPFDYTNLEQYEQRCKQANLADSNEYLIDNDSSPVKPITGLSLENIQLQKSDKNMFLVTGQEYAGKRNWSVALASAAFESGKKVVVIDFTAAQGVLEFASDSDAVFTEITSLDFIHCRLKDGINLVKFRFKDSIVPFCKYVLQAEQVFDDIFVICDLSEVKVISSALCNRIKCCIACTFATDSDVVQTTSFCGTVADRQILTMHAIDGLTEITAEDVKLKYPDWGVVRPFKFERYTGNQWLYKKVVGNS